MQIVFGRADAHVRNHSAELLGKTRLIQCRHPTALEMRSHAQDACGRADPRAAYTREEHIVRRLLDSRGRRKFGHRFKPR